MDVGIVTALAVERAAVQTVIAGLVERAVPGDPNHYLVGDLASREAGRPHRVVVAVQARDGTRNAAAIGTDLLRSFPGVRCLIMCGIAGGVPAPVAPERHVRLGDIISATGGVIDYDHTRTVDGVEHLRRSVGGLSTTLLRADRELEVKELRGYWPWHAWVTSRPQDGWPRVHRCAIGSADRLVRDAVKRDEIAQRHGVRAVEMEASGLAVAADLHDRHWFIVRGVADYCDNESKNDIWHPYASLAAAAYTRALLAECAPFVDAQSPGKPGDIAHVLDALLEIPQMRDDYQRRAIMALLPDHIRTMIADNVHGRLHVLAMIQTCIDARDGRESLLAALRLSLPEQSPQLRQAVAVIDQYWP
jgi:nucleoside phosphorylase